MLYNEFIEGTGCRNNAHNYQLYKELEIIYMNTDCTKEHIYDMGRKLMDNSKTEEEIRFEKEIKEKIRQHKECATDYKNQIELEKSLIIPNREYIKYCMEMMRYHKQKIVELKWVLG